MRKRTLLHAAVPIMALVIASCGDSSSSNTETRSRQANTPGAQVPAAVGAQVRQASHVDAAHGWALTDDALMWTADAGSSWATITPPSVSAADIVGVDFTAARGVVAMRMSRPAGESATAVMITTDQGRTWRPDGELATGVEATTVSFASDGDVEYALAKLASSANFDRGLFFAHEASSWRQLGAELDAARALAVGDAGRGVVIGGPAFDRVLLTRNAGRTWTEASVGGQGRRFGAAAVADGQLVVAATTGSGGDTSEELLTSDDGITWTTVGSIQTGEDTQMMPADVLSTSSWYVGGARGVYRGGSQPVGPRSSGLAGAVTAVDFASNNVGWVIATVSGCAGEKANCSSTSALYATSDGGETWSQLAIR